MAHRDPWHLIRKPRLRNRTLRRAAIARYGSLVEARNQAMASDDPRLADYITTHASRGGTTQR